MSLPAPALGGAALASPAARCRHCRNRQASRPRGLCRRCFADRAVRRQYPPLTSYGNRQPDHGFKTARVPAEPTDAPPGSPEKVRVLIERQAKGQQLWHPLDARIDLA